MKTMMINNGNNEKAGLYFYNNINNINQQHIARKTTHCALKGYMINNIDNSLAKDNLDNFRDNRDNG